MEANSKSSSQKFSIVLIILGCIFFSLQLNAQAAKPSPKSPEERAKNLTEKMKETLSLTEDQYTSVYDINLKYGQQNDKLASSSDTKRVKFQKMKANQAAKDKELQDVLTEDQFTQYEHLKAAMKEKAKENYEKKKQQASK